jgi:hypothetical protein
MKSVSCIVLLAVMVISKTLGQEQQLFHELLGAKYGLRGETSRLVLTFNEPVRFMHKKVNNKQIRLSFPQTASARYANGVPLMFSSGLARSVAFDFSRPDTLALLINLKANVAYEVRKPKGTSQVVMEMYTSDTASIVGPLIDIKAMMQQQIEDAKKREGDINATRTEGFFDVQPIPFLAACFIALLGTAGMMFWIIKRPPPRKPAPHRVSLPAAKHEAGVEAILAQARLILQEKAGVFPRRVALETGAASEEAALTLAKKFGRGQGEFEFVKQAQSGNRHYMWEKKLQMIDSARTGRESVSTAKKLGVGRGELALALSLRRLQENLVERKESGQ